MTVTDEATRASEPAKTTESGVGEVGVGARPRARHRLADTPTERLEAELTSLAHNLHFGTYELLVLVRELDVRGTWAAWGALSCAAWLAELCDIEVGTARTQVRVAHALRTWPELDRAMAIGDISYAKARTLAAHCTDDNVEALVAIARTTPAGRLGAAIAAWSMRNEDQDVIDERHHDERSLSWRTDPDGMVTFTIKVPPEQAGKVQAVIDTEVKRHDPAESPPTAPTRNVDEAASDASADASPDVPTTPDGFGKATPRLPSPVQRRADASAGSDRRELQFPSLAQQRVDAFLRILDAPGTPDTSVGGVAKAVSVSEVLVHVRPEGNALADGTPLSDHAVARLLPGSFVSLLLEDNRRRPIDASPRRRFPTRRQRRVLDAREDECAHPGCHARTFLQYDHIEPYHRGGPTTIDNLQRLCGPHNRARVGSNPDSAPAPGNAA